MCSIPMNDTLTERRNNNPKLTVIAKAFEPANADLMNGTCGNIAASEELGPIYEKVSAPYLLARLCALFSGLTVVTEGQEGYKVTWSVVLTHKATGHVITFYDWKGAAAYGSDLRGIKDAPKDFLRDVKSLLKSLTDDRCPHPYDGCIVGEVA